MRRLTPVMGSRMKTDVVALSKEKLQKEQMLTESVLEKNRIVKGGKISSNLLETYLKNTFKFGSEEDQAYCETVDTAIANLLEFIDVKRTVKSFTGNLSNALDLLTESGTLLEDNDMAYNELMEMIQLTHQHVEATLRDDLKVGLSESEEHDPEGNLVESMIFNIFKMDKTEALKEGGEDVLNENGEAHSQALMKSSIKRAKTLILFENLEIKLNKNVTAGKLEKDVLYPLLGMSV